MKRGTPDHPKTAALMANLDISKCHAIGILESIWHMGMRYAPCGDIGKHTDGTIATHIGWGGDVDLLITALLNAGWLEAHQQHRLIIHDWQDHCDQTTKRFVTSHNLSFVSSGPANASTMRANDSLPVPVPVPVPEPEPESEPDNNTPAKRAEGDSAKPTNGAYPGFDAWFDAYPRGPRRVGKKKCLARWKRDNLEPRADELLANLEAWKVSEEWTKDGGKFICGPLPFLNQERYDLAESDLKPGNVDRTAQPYARTRDWREALDEAKRQERTA